MTNIAPVTLPGGFWQIEKYYGQAELRAFTGNDEAFLLEVGESLLPVQRTTALLTRCLTRLGPFNPVTTEAVRSLTVGDREALLLHLRLLTFGDRLQCVLDCPNPDCGERMDLELKVSDLLLPPYSDVQASHETTVRENGSAYRVCFRLPTGADQGTAVSLARSDPDVATDLILHRCVERVTIESGDSEPIEDLPPAIKQQLPAIMGELDPQAELVLDLTCPVCSHAFSALFDTADFFFKELATRTQNLYREVHLLALYYHWSEAEIMGMTTRKRRRYLELLEDSLKREGYQ